MDKKTSVGIIAEYNPFHNGHKYQLDESRARSGAEVVIAAMSGNFVQRGQAAVADKWQRAETAVKCGADLVVEIPVIFACNSAPYFAEAAVRILENLAADCISFGSESGDIEELMDIARAMSEKEDEIEAFAREKVKEGLAYPRARREVTEQIMGEKRARLLDSPNNILALEYLKKMTAAKPMTIKRMGPGYNDMKPCEEFASATAIRHMLAEDSDISLLLPEVSRKMLAKGERPSETALFDMIRNAVLRASAEELDRTFAGGEGLGNKLKNVIRKASSYEDLIEQLKSKRYTRTRIERFLIQMLLGIENVSLDENYIRVLAFNDRGSAYLKNVKKSGICSLPIITNINKEAENNPEIKGALDKDILASDIYNLASGRDLYLNSDYVKKPVKV